MNAFTISVFMSKVQTSGSTTLQIIQHLLPINNKRNLSSSNKSISQEIIRKEKPQLKVIWKINPYSQRYSLWWHMNQKSDKSYLLHMVFHQMRQLHPGKWNTVLEYKTFHRDLLRQERAIIVTKGEFRDLLEWTLTYRAILGFFIVDVNSLHRVGSYRSWNSPLVTNVARTWRGKSLCNDFSSTFIT